MEAPNPPVMQVRQPVYKAHGEMGRTVVTAKAWRLAPNGPRVSLRFERGLTPLVVPRGALWRASFHACPRFRHLLPSFQSPINKTHKHTHTSARPSRFFQRKKISTINQEKSPGIDTCATRKIHTRNCSTPEDMPRVYNTPSVQALRVSQLTVVAIKHAHAARSHAQSNNTSQTSPLYNIYVRVRTPLFTCFGHLIFAIATITITTTTWAQGSSKSGVVDKIYSTT